MSPTLLVPWPVSLESQRRLSSVGLWIAVALVLGPVFRSLWSGQGFKDYLTCTPGYVLRQQRPCSIFCAAQGTRRASETLTPHPR